MKSSLELEGLSLLHQTQSSLKKSLFRNIIIHVERKIFKDCNSISRDHLFLILLNETKAVHKLLDQAIIDKLKEKPSILIKLISIMSRNLKVCLSLLTTKLEQFIIYLDYPSAKKHTFTPQQDMSEFCHQIQTFFSVLLKSYYYFYVMNKQEKKILKSMKQISEQSKLILQCFTDCKSKSTQHNIAISQTILLFMSICIAESKFQEAQFYFEKATVFILTALRTAYLRSAQKSKNQLKQISQLKQMLLICLINSQRMLIIGKNQLSGWDFGFAVVKMIQNCLGSRGIWNKYIRIQYQIKHIIELNQFTQIKQMCKDLLSEHLEPIQKQYLQMKNSKNITNCRQIKVLQDRVSFQAKNTKIQNSSKQILFVNKHKNSNIIDNYEIKKCLTKQLKRNKLINYGSFFNFTNPSNDIQIQNKYKNYNKCIKKQSSSYLLPQQTKDSMFKRNKLIVQHKSKKGAQIYKILNYKEDGKKNSKRLKRIALNTNSLLNLTNRSLNCTQQASIAFQKQAIKAKSKQKMLHRLILNDGYQCINLKQINPYLQEPSDNKKSIKSIGRQQQQIHSNLIDKLVNILLRNKNKIGIKLLSQRYELAMKRKRVRNYESQLIQLDIQKQLNIFISNTTINSKKQEKLNSNSKNLKTLLENMQSSHSIKKFNEKQKPNVQIYLESSFNKSKSAIGEMLKKISISGFSKTTRSNRQIYKKYNNSFY